MKKMGKKFWLNDVFWILFYFLSIKNEKNGKKVLIKWRFLDFVLLFINKKFKKWEKSFG